MRSLLCFVLLLGGCGGCDDAAHAPDATGVDGAPDATAAPALTATTGWNNVALAWTATAPPYTIYRSATAELGTMIATTDALAFADADAPHFARSYYTIVAAGATSNQADAFAFDLDHWSQKASGIALADVAYAQATAAHPAIFVAAGNAGQVLVSPDAMTWTTVVGPPMDISAIAFGGSSFVATGTDLAGQHGAIATSPDGVTWSAVVPPMAATYRDVVAATEGPTTAPTVRYIAVGVNGTGAIATSTDGTTWIPKTCGLGVFDTIAITQRVVAGSNRFVAVAAGDRTLCWSIDGLIWTNVNAQTESWIAAASDSSTDQIIIASRGGQLARFHWDFASSTATIGVGTPIPTGATRIAAFTSMRVGLVRWFFAMDTTGKIYVSSDAGATWTDHGATYAASMIGFTAPRNIVAAGGFVFVPGDSAQLYRSADFAGTFELANDGLDASYIGVATSHGHTVAIDAAGVLMISDDAGATWRRRSAGTPALSPIVATSSGFAFIAGPPLAIARSTDGETWTTTPIPHTLCTDCTYSRTAIAANGDDVSAVTYIDGFPPRMIGIANGVATAATPVSYPIALEYDAANGLAMIASDAILGSHDATTWTQIAMHPLDAPLGYLHDGTTRYLGSYDGLITRSTDDSATWSTPEPIAPGIAALAKSGGLVFALGRDGYVAASSDGQSFQSVVVPTRETFTGFVVTATGFVAIGNRGVIISAP